MRVCWLFFCSLWVVVLVFRFLFSLSLLFENNGRQIDFEISKYQAVKDTVRNSNFSGSKNFEIWSKRIWHQEEFGRYLPASLVILVKMHQSTRQAIER
jgi:hypothetical protein